MQMRFLAGLVLLGLSVPASAELVMFSQRNFQGVSYALQAAGNSLSFSPRSVRVLPDQPWELCPRPFFGGTCITVSDADPKLNLPRGFSGMVRSARPAPAGGTAPAAPADAEKKDPKS
jgi:hypothetical protein